jgi:hypothetical protein
MTNTQGTTYLPAKAESNTNIFLTDDAEYGGQDTIKFLVRVAPYLRVRSHKLVLRTYGRRCTARGLTTTSGVAFVYAGVLDEYQKQTDRCKENIEESQSAVIVRECTLPWSSSASTFPILILSQL